VASLHALTERYACNTAHLKKGVQKAIAKIICEIPRWLIITIQVNLVPNPVEKVTQIHMHCHLPLTYHHSYFLFAAFDFTCIFFHNNLLRGHTLFSAGLFLG